MANVDALSNSDIRRLIDDFIHNAKYRDVLKDRFIDGLTYCEIADKRGYSERQVKNIVYKGELKIFSKTP